MRKQIDMNWANVERDWEYYRSTVKARWGKLSPAHLDMIAGDRTRLAGAITEVYALSEIEIEKQIQYFEERHQNYQPESSSCSRWRRV
jgi:uncharacterized protein YjbJ (UPF0337 family)